MKKLLFLLTIILLNITFVHTVLAANGDPNRKAEGDKCTADSGAGDCETGTRCIIDVNDVRYKNAVGKERDGVHGVCIKNAAIPANNDPKKVNCQSDQTSDVGDKNRAALAYQTCEAGSLCQDGVCKPFRCIQPPATDKNGKPKQDTAFCEGNIDSNDHGKAEGGKLCCANSKCDDKTKQCVAQKQSEKPTTGACIDPKKHPQQKDQGCKADLSPSRKGAGADIQDTCCEGFRCADVKKDGKEHKVCVSTNDKSVCKGEGEKAEGDTTTKNKQLSIDKLCCDKLILGKDGKCTKEIVCLDKGDPCTRGTWKCCGEQSCIINPKNLEGKTPAEAAKVQGTCQEGLPFPPSPPCTQGQFKDGKCQSVTTAFGNLSTDPEKFIRSIFGVMLAMSGGIALLLVMKSGYLIMTSDDKPEALQQGREQLIAAIVGLTFLIFSFVLLQVIGFEIIKIPQIKP